MKENNGEWDKEIAKVHDNDMKSMLDGELKRYNITI